MKMTPRPPEDDPLPKAFTQWLSTPVSPDPDAFLQRLRERIQHPEPDLDLLIDALLEPDSRCYDPRFLFRLKARILEESRPAAWSKWARIFAPIAAAAAIAFAVVSISPVPQSAQKPLMTDIPGEQLSPDPVLTRTPESDLTRILALASTLPAATDLSRLQSETALALLQQ